MFFNCYDRKASLESRRIPTPKAALALAVAAAAPVIWAPAAHANNAVLNDALALLADQAKPTDPELLAKGVEQYDKGQYENAQVTLQQVKGESLSEKDQETLKSTLQKVEGALGERKSARAAFEKGQEALGDKKYDEALKQFRAAADSKYADEATRSKAADQIAVVEAMSKPANPGTNADATAAAPAAESGQVNTHNLYKQAVADYKSGRLEEAKAKFQKCEELGYHGGLFDRKTGSFIGEINKRLAAPTAVADANPPKTTDTTPAANTDNAARVNDAGGAPQGDAEGRGEAAYKAGKAAYEKREYQAARQNFQAARDLNYKPGWFQDPPSKWLARIDEKEHAPVAQGTTADVNTTTTTVAANPPTTGPAVPPADPDLQTTATIRRMRDQERAYEAEQFVKKAREAEDANRYADAYDLYGNAHRLDPNNAVATEGFNRTQTLVGKGGGDESLMQRAINAKQIRRQSIRYSFDRAIADAQAAIGRHDWTAAQEGVDRARVASDSSPADFNREELAQMNSVIASTQLNLNNARGSVAIEQGRTQEEQARIAAEQRAALEARERRRTVQTLVRTARQMIYDGQYSQALGVLNQILSIDPSNDYAIGVKQLVQDYAVLQEQRKFREQFDREFQKQMNSASEKKIPYMDIMQYPDNWPNISELRDREVAAERRAGGSVDTQTQALLDRQLPEIKFEAVALSDVIDFLRDVSGANIFVNWKTIEAAGIERTAPVTARLRNIRFSKALSTILSDVGGGLVKLSYTVDEGVITISTAEDLNKNTGIQVYDIRDLLVIPPEIRQPPDFDLSSNGTGGGGGRGGGGRGGGGGGGRGGGGGGSGQGLFGSMSAQGQGQQQNEDIKAKTDQLVKDIQDLIKETVDRESWIDNGGKVGAIKFLSGQLIVTQTPENHRQLQALLDKLRETRAIQVSIETRFLQVQRNFLEDVGVDLDFFFNINNPNHWSPIPVSTNTAAFTQAPTTTVPGSIGSTANPGIQIQGSFLDDFQVNFLIRATQAAVNSTTLTAPRVTVFNGQTAYVVVASQQAYVSDLEAVTGEGVGLFNPIVDTVQSGVRLVVTPTVSADRKYVTLSLQPQVSQLVSLVNFPVFGIQNGNNNNNNNNNGGNAQVTQAQIQLPLIQLTSVNTIVSVPDGGTLLLGGQTLAGEIEKEEGVPILSKIPVIKRLFTNKSFAKDEQVLLILVKPTIIIQREVEQQQFPLLNTKK